MSLSGTNWGALAEPTVYSRSVTQAILYSKSILMVVLS